MSSFLRTDLLPTISLVFLELENPPHKQEDLTPETTKALIEGLKAGKPPKAGPQSGRHSSEAKEGRTALTTEVSFALELMNVCAHFDSR